MEQNPNLRLAEQAENSEEEIDESILTINTMRDGRVAKLINAAIEDILEDIADVNIKAEMIRELNVKVKFRPSPTRESYTIEGEVWTKLGRRESETEVGYIKRDKKTGKITGHRVNPNQMELPTD